jgi:hypothetical protein
MMAANAHQRLLRTALRLDALVSAGFGVLVLLGGPLLADVLGLPAGLLWPVGGVVVAYAAGLWLAQARTPISVSIGWSVIALNVAWASASVVAVVLGWWPLTGLGMTFVLLQAVVVAGFADLQFVGVRRAVA